MSALDRHPAPAADTAAATVAAALPSAARRGLSAVHALLIVAFGLLVMLPGIGSNRTLTQHEVFAAQPAREMLHTGDWIIPHFGELPRLVKMPTASWAIAASMAVFNSEAEWVVRLPSVLAAIAAALLIAAMTASWLGSSFGLLVGLLQLGSHFSLMQGRLAEADMPLAAAVIAAMACFAAGVVNGAGRRPRLAGFGFYIAGGLAFLFKGPIGPALIGVGCLTYVIARREWHSLRFFWSPAGILAGVVMIAAWPFAAIRAYPPIVEVWTRETIGRATGEFGNESALTYLIDVPVLLLPWTPFVLLGLWTVWRDNLRRRPYVQLLGAWTIAGFAVLVLVSAKHKHYAIPLLPPFMLAAAAGLMAAADWLAARRIGQTPVSWAVAVMSAIILAWAAARYAPATGVPGIVMACGFPLAVTATLTLLKLADRRIALTAMFATVAAFVAAVSLWIVPLFDRRKPTAELAARVNQAVHAGAPIHIVGMEQAAIAYYLRLPVRLASLEGLTAMIDAGRTVDAVMPDTLLETVRPKYRIEIVNGPVQEESAYGPRRGRVIVHARIAPPGPL